MSTALHTPHRMTVAEFERWDPPAGLEDRRWELVDGEPVCMAPANVDHGAIQSQTCLLIGIWLRAHRPSCRVITTPGVIPRVQSDRNERIPDLGITCGPLRPAKTLVDPLVLIEILSPSNEAKTRANVWAYTSIPSVEEILILSGTKIEAELLCRSIDRTWPERPTILTDHDELHLRHIDYRAALSAHYETTSFRLADA